MMALPCDAKIKGKRKRCALPARHGGDHATTWNIAPVPDMFPVPASAVGLRGYWARQGICPECGCDLDTGWECNTCNAGCVA